MPEPETPITEEVPNEPSTPAEQASVTPTLAEIQAQHDAQITELNQKLETQVSDNVTLTEQVKALQESEVLLQTQVQERDTRIASLESTVVERDTAITEKDAAIAERDLQLQAASAQVTDEKTLKEAEIAASGTFQYLFDKCQADGGKAAWLILNDLRKCRTQAEVDEQFESVKKRDNLLVENAAATYRAARILAETDEDGNPPEVNKPGKTAKDRDKEVVAEIAKAYGVI